MYYDPNFIHLSREHSLSIEIYATGGALIAAKRGRQKANYYCFTTFGEMKGRK
jgi:hypothetical protein